MGSVDEKLLWEEGGCPQSPLELKAEPMDVCAADKENETGELWSAGGPSSPSSALSSELEDALERGLDSGDSSSPLWNRNRRWKRTDVLSCSEGGFRCGACHRRFRSAGLLDRHRLRCAAGPSSTLLHCAECGLTLASRRAMQRHAVLHRSRREEEEERPPPVLTPPPDLATPEFRQEAEEAPAL